MEDTNSQREKGPSGRPKFDFSEGKMTQIRLSQVWIRNRSVKIWFSIEGPSGDCTKAPVFKAKL